MTLFSLLMSLFVFSAPLDVEDVFQSNHNTFAKTSNGMWWSIGFQSGLRELGINTIFKIEASALSFEDVFVTEDVTCGITTGTREVWCWGDPMGYSYFGGQSDVPILIYNTTQAIRFAKSSNTSAICFIDENNEVFCFGFSVYLEGIWGNGTTTMQYLIPTKILDSSKNVVEFIFGIHNSCYLDILGDIFCSGINDFHNLGVYANSNVWTKLTIDNAIDFDLTLNRACIVKSNGSVLCAGICDMLLCDDPTAIFTSDFVNVGFTNSTNVSIGRNHICSLSIDGSVQCVGENNDGQVGCGSKFNKFPCTVQSIASVNKIFLFDNTSCVINNQKMLICWGNSNGGSLEDSLKNTINGKRVIDEDCVKISSVNHFSTQSVQKTCYLSHKKILCSGLSQFSDTYYRDVIPYPVHLSNLYKNERILYNVPYNFKEYNEKTYSVNFNNFFYFPLNLDTSNRSTLFSFGKNDFSCGRLNCFFKVDNNTLLLRGSPQIYPSRAYSEDVGLRQIYKESDAFDNTLHASLSLGTNCFLTKSKEVWCLGENNYGQLGDGTITASPKPYAVKTGFSNVKQIAAASDTTCVLKTDNTVWCVGRATNGALGNGLTTPNQTSPVQVKTDVNTPLTDVRSVHGGYRGNCAVKNDGTVWCWGINHLGQWCTASPTTYLYATQVMNGASPFIVSKISIQDSDTSYFLTTDKKLYACGDNEGLLGDGTTNATNKTPTLISFSVPKINSVSIGDNHMCYKDELQAVWCKGRNNNGQLGTGNSEYDGSFPVNPVLHNKNIRQISAGSNVTCSILYDKSVVCFGDNQYGKLGRNTKEKNIPVKIKNLGGTNSLVSTKSDHVCALKEDGTVWCWGRNKDGQLGVGDNTDKYKAVQTLLTGIYIDVAVGTDHSCAVKNDGTVWCWGNNRKRQLGDARGLSTNKPVQVQGLTGVARVTLGNQFSCALKSNGQVWCWGNNEFGTLGIGTIANAKTPIQTSIADVSYLAAGLDHVCAVKADGTAHCWGSNENLKVGQNRVLRRVRAPMQVSSVSNANSISCGTNTSCVTKTDGTMQCWGKTQGMTFWD